MPEAVIVAAVRTPVGKAPNGALRHTRPDDLPRRPSPPRWRGAGARRRRGRGRHPRLRDAGGRAGPERGAHRQPARRRAAQRVGRHRQPLLRLGPAVDRLRRRAHPSGAADVVIAGGTESMSLVPMGGLQASRPTRRWSTPTRTSISRTGSSPRTTPAQSKISREAQDAFAFDSHRKAVAAIDAGRFADEIVPVDAAIVDAAPAVGRAPAAPRRMDTDEGPRRDTSPEALAKLKPAFHATGSVTAGNTSQTSDGAAAVIVMSATRAAALGLKPLARFVGYATAGVRAGALRHRPGAGDPQGAGADRALARRHGSRRAERGVRGADPRLPRRAADRSGAPQRQRRRHRPRPSRSAAPARA